MDKQRMNGAEKKRPEKKVPKEISVRPDLYDRYKERGLHGLNNQTSCSPFAGIPSYI